MVGPPYKNGFYIISTGSTSSSSAQEPRQAGLQPSFFQCVEHVVGEDPTERAYVLVHDHDRTPARFVEARDDLVEEGVGTHGDRLGVVEEITDGGGGVGEEEIEQPDVADEAAGLAALAHRHLGPVLTGTVVPRVTGGFDATAVLFIIAIVGTTVAPWQLFFEQSNVVDKRITTRFLCYELADTVIGAVLTNVGAAALIVATAFAFAHSHLAGHFASALSVAQGLASRVSPLAGDLFAVILINAAILGASAVTLSTSYALRDSFGVKHSLHRKVIDAKAFYGSFAALVALAAGIVLIPGAPLGLMTTGVQVLAGVLLPSAIVFLLLLCNDSAVLGPWVNTTRQNVVASLIVAVLVLLSLIVTITTVFPTVPFGSLVASLTALGALGLSVLGGSARRRGGHLAAERLEATKAPRDTWRMPALATLAPPVWSAQRKLGLLALRAYLVVAVVLLAVKIGQVAVGG